MVGQGIAVDEDTALFASYWASLDAIKHRFGDEWQEPFLPDGYEDLIEDCSVQHFNIGEGWQGAGPPE